MDREAAVGRFVIWSHAESATGWSSGIGYAFLSESAIRILRAIGAHRIPAAEVVSLSQLERGLTMYLGSDSDSRSYKSTHHD